MADVIKGEMLRGQIDTVILLALVEGDKDSNDIRTAIEEKSDNQYSIKKGTFYSAMQRLVKQGYIKEYRSSAMDGIRRKYFSITPKGNKFLDKNREQWTASKTLVDSMFETDDKKVEEKPIVEQKTEEKYVDEFDSFKAFVDDNGDDFIVQTEDQDNEYFDNIGADVLSDLNNELEKQEQSLPRFEDEKTEIITDKSSDFEENYDSVPERSKEEIFAFDVFDDDGLVKEVKPENDTSDEIPSDKNTPNVYQEFYQDLEEDLEVEQTKPTAKVEEKVETQDDDLLIVEEYSPTNKNKYKQILNKILPKDFAKEDSPEKAESPSNYQSETNVEETYSKEELVVEEKTKQEKIEEKPTEKTSDKPVRYEQQDPSDFSDLYAMANREGFKIRTSHNTNKFVGNQILLNKLVLHSSLVFFIILALECLILNFALSSILNWKLSVKLIILGGLAIFPLVSLIVYLINSKRSVYEVAQFKDAMSVALIITFQLAIIILCVALFVSVDFNNFKEVTTYILLPFILAINIPLYFILKYSLLSTGKYFTKQ